MDRNIRPEMAVTCSYDSVGISVPTFAERSRLVIGAPSTLAGCLSSEL